MICDYQNYECLAQNDAHQSTPRERVLHHMAPMLLLPAPHPSTPFHSLVFPPHWNHFQCPCFHCPRIHPYYHLQTVMTTPHHQKAKVGILKKSG